MNILEIGIAHGMKQGNTNTLRSVIENMLQHEMPDEDIKMYTGCDQDFIDHIRHEPGK